MIPSASRFASRGIPLLGAGTLVTLVACSSPGSGNNDGGSGGGDGAPACAMPGGAASGPQDTHCDGMPVQMVYPATCNGGFPPDGGPGGGDDGGAGGDDGGGPAEGGAGNDAGGGGDDGGAADAGDIGNCGNDAFGATMYNSRGEDDDCKYDITWTSTPICEGQPVYFTVTAKYRADNSPLIGANARPDVVLDCTHIAPRIGMAADPSPESPPGTYRVGPVVFDKPGKWVVRFHFFEMCQDQPFSPHGHAAFYVQVP